MHHRGVALIAFYLNITPQDIIHRLKHFHHDFEPEISVSDLTKFEKKKNTTKQNNQSMTHIFIQKELSSSNFAKRITITNHF